MTRVKTASSYIREHLDAIEKQMQMGVYQEVICQEVNDAGYRITLPAFRKAIMRARQRRTGHMSNAGLQPPVMSAFKGKRLNERELEQLTALQLRMGQAPLASS